MSSHKLTLRHISDEATIVLLLLINRLLLLRYVIIVGHINAIIRFATSSGWSMRS